LKKEEIQAAATFSEPHRNSEVTVNNHSINHLSISEFIS
jgi:hypothetical protein